MEMNHFSHGEHPLILVADCVDMGKVSRHLVCNGCHEPVIIDNTRSSGYYRCSARGCKFTLHRRCAELPPQIDYPLHAKHPLILYPFPPYGAGYCTCNTCGRERWTGFTYHCPHCYYDVDAICAIATLDLLSQGEEASAKKRIFENKEIHQHPLTLQLKPASFLCDACSTKGEDFPYICTNSICPFWIHKRCAHVPPTLHLIHHHPDHPLRLSFSLPQMYHSFNYYCSICKEMMHRSHWLYYCVNCKFFSHINCAFKARKGTYINIDQPRLRIFLNIRLPPE